MDFEPRDAMNNDDELVECCFGCPRCRERRFDYLEWVGEDMEDVECQTCAKVYSPLGV